jgi:hypothetical protein
MRSTCEKLVEIKECECVKRAQHCANTHRVLKLEVQSCTSSSVGTHHIHLHQLHHFLSRKRQKRLMVQYEYVRAHTQTVRVPVAAAGWQGNSSACVQGDEAARPEGEVIANDQKRSKQLFKWE